MILTPYPKPPKLRFGKYENCESGNSLTLLEQETLLRGRVAVEEKMPGREVSADAGRYTLYAMDLGERRPPGYPARFAVFEVLDKTTEAFLSPSARSELVQGMSAHEPEAFSNGGMFPVPILRLGVLRESDLAAFLKSVFARAAGATRVVGVVVKPDRAWSLEEVIKDPGRQVNPMRICGNIRRTDMDYTPPPELLPAGD